jgi:WhiB family redox-sensing transcriptional regulator
MSILGKINEAFDMDKAACKTADPEIFFPEKMTVAAAYEAKQYCASCPVVMSCLLWALENKEFGIWGGSTEVERRRMKTRDSVNYHLRKLSVISR